MNLRDIVYMVRKKSLDPSQPITTKELYECGAVYKPKYGVVLLGKGVDDYKEMGEPIHFEVQHAS